MKQSLIDRCVARKTGESRRTISRHGFSLLEDEPAGRVDEVSISVECDGRSRSVSLAVAQYGATEPEAACDVVDALFATAADELFAIDGTARRLVSCT